jgi:hypothetical protein
MSATPNLLAPVLRNGFPFAIPDDVTGGVTLWDGSDFTVNLALVCGPGTRFPTGMTLAQMTKLYWRAKKFTLTATAATSNYGIESLDFTYQDTVWPDMTSSPDPIPLYQTGTDDSSQAYPADQLNADVPYPLVLPVYRLETGSPPPSPETPPIPPTMASPGGGVAEQGGTPFVVRLFQYGAVKYMDAYYPSIEISATASLGFGINPNLP